MIKTGNWRGAVVKGFIKNSNNLVVAVMPVKRKSRGRRKGDKGSEGMVQCDNCGAFVPRSKITRVTRRVSLVSGDLARELKKQGVYIAESVVTKNLCISCAIHYGVLKVRAREERKKPATI